MSKLKGHFPLEKGKKISKKVVKMIGGQTLVCGSIRRKSDFIGDIDIVAIETRELVDKLLKNGFEIKNSMATNIIDDIPVVVYFADNSNWGSMIMHFTGSKELNIMMRSTARKKGMTLNQYGLFEDLNCIASRTEEDIYNVLGMKFLKPEDRNKSFD